jgi:menaquinone-dependent protoporphyrinogen oxidase
MTRPLLVAYATKHGSTEEVAEAIAATLRKQDLLVELHQAADVRDLAPYGGVVLGGALYMGRLHADARRFLRRHYNALVRVPIAVFAMGPLTTDEAQVESSWKQLRHALSGVPRLSPISTAIFGGTVDPSELHFPFNHMPASDARDWDLVDSWARELAAAFGQAPVPAAPAS